MEEEECGGKREREQLGTKVGSFLETLQKNINGSWGDP